jgi:hypothetical protein
MTPAPFASRLRRTSGRLRPNRVSILRTKRGRQTKYPRTTLPATLAHCKQCRAYQLQTDEPSVRLRVAIARAETRHATAQVPPLTSSPGFYHSGNACQAKMQLPIAALLATGQCGCSAPTSRRAEGGRQTISNARLCHGWLAQPCLGHHGRASRPWHAAYLPVGFTTVNAALASVPEMMSMT